MCVYCAFGLIIHKEKQAITQAQKALKKAFCLQL